MVLAEFYGYTKLCDRSPTSFIRAIRLSLFQFLTTAHQATLLDVDVVFEVYSSSFVYQQQQQPQYLFLE